MNTTCDQPIKEHFNRKHNIDDKFFCQIDTQEKAYVLGFFYADGHTSKKQYTVNFTSKDIQILQDISCVMKSTYPIRSITQSPSKKGKNKTTSYYNVITASSIHLSEHLKKMIGVNKSLTFFDFTKYVPKHLHRHYLRGYFDGDGSIYICQDRPVIQFTSGNQKNIDLCTKILFENGITKNIIKTYQRKKESVYYCKLCCGLRLAKLYDYFYDDATIYLKRKQERWFNSIKDSHMIKVCEEFKSIQGEGSTVGKNLFFVRVEGCTLNCVWCDTKYSRRGGKYITIHKLYNNFIRSGANGVCITGGEGLLYRKAISNLLLNYKFKHIEIETNGTINPDEGLSEAKKLTTKITVFNISPKLSTSDNPKDKRYKPLILKKLSELPNTIFKFVITSEDDLTEIDTIVSECKIDKNKIFLMPEGATKKEQEKRMKRVAEISIEKGYNFSPRLHVLIWDNKRGV